VNGIARIHLDTFENSHGSERIKDQWNRLSKRVHINGLIIDLRGNTGGSLDQATSFLETLLPPGTVTTRRQIVVAQDNTSKNCTVNGKTGSCFHKSTEADNQLPFVR